MSQEGGEGAAQTTEPQSESTESLLEVKTAAELSGGKFDSSESMWHAYQAAQQKITELGQAQKPEKKVYLGLEGVFEAAGLDPAATMTGIEGGTQLTDDQWDAIEKTGIDRERVAQQIEAHTKVRQADSVLAEHAKRSAVESAAKIVGGEQQLHQMLSLYAEANQPDAVEQMKAKLQDPSHAEDAALSLAGWYGLRSGGRAPLLAGQRPPPGSTAPRPFQSRAEEQAARQALREQGVSPESDPDYMNRLKASTDAGTLRETRRAPR